MSKTLVDQPDVYLGFPTPLVLVSCADGGGKGNILTIAWAGIVSSDPPMVSISVRRGKYSHHLIKAGGEFVVNLPTEQLVKVMDYCGTVSGKNVDKWENAGVTPVSASRVKAPLIAESPVNMECVIKHTLHLGSHDCFVAEVVAIHVDDQCLKNGKLDSSTIRPLIYFCRDYWGITAEQVAPRGVGVSKR